LSENKSNPTRRAVLAGAVTAAGASVGGLLWSELRQRRARVLALRSPTYHQELAAQILEGTAAFPQLRARARGASVLLKPNLVEAHVGRPINTDPRFIAAVVEVFQRLGASEVVVGEGPGHMRDTEAILELTGLEEHLHPHGVRFVDLNVDEGVFVPTLRNFTKLGSVPIARSVMQADLVVSLPKLKTHHWVGATLSMKNLFGAVPGALVGWPKNPLHWAGIPNSIADIWSCIQPGFAIVDGIVAMEGDGPIMGTPVPQGAVFLSDNLPALDAHLARLMGLDASAMGYLNRALALGGTTSSWRTEAVGDRIPGRRYELVDRLAGLRGPVSDHG
jgi:uncharacterized protein (DUF362 family)